MDKLVCVECSSATAEDEYHIRDQGKCVRIKMTVYRTDSGHIVKAVVL